MLQPPAKFLFKLGLRRHPPIQVILGIAAGDEPQRTVALSYFLDNYMQKYRDYWGYRGCGNYRDSTDSMDSTDHPDYTTSVCYEDYDPNANGSIAFVPAVHRGEKKLVRPLGVFTGPDWQSLGFPVLDPNLRKDAANKLKIKEYPSTNQLIHLLEVSPPTTESQAREWFGVLSRRVPGSYNI